MERRAGAGKDCTCKKLWAPKHPFWRMTLRGLNWDNEPRITPSGMVEVTSREAAQAWPQNEENDYEGEPTPPVPLLPLLSPQGTCRIDSTLPFPIQELPTSPPRLFRSVASSSASSPIS